MEAWLKSSWYFQQNVFKNVKDRYWENLDEDSIIEKIKFVLLDCYGDKYLETEKCEELVKDISELIFKHYPVNKKMDKTRYFSCTFLNVWLIDDKKESTEGVFWTKNKDNGKEICIDTKCRKYKNWEDFTENNMLPESYLIFPKIGRYTTEDGSDSDYKELIFQKSIACGSKRKIKKYVDTGASVVTLAGAGVLAFNPVSLPITVTAATVSVIGGVVNAGFAVERLVDNCEREEVGYQTIFAVSDVLVSALGVAAVGVTSSCKVLASTEKFLCNSAIVIKIGSTTATVCKAMTAVNGIHAFVKAIVEYRENGHLDLKTLKFLKLTINFIFLICVSLPLVKRLVQYMSSHSLDLVINSLANQFHNKFAYVKRGCSILDDLKSLIQRVCPRELPIMKQIIDSPVVKFVSKVIINIKQKGSKDPLNLIYDLFIQLPELLKEIDKYFLQSKQQIEDDFGKESAKLIEKCAGNEKIVIGNEHSFSMDKISICVYLKNKVNETLLALNVKKRNGNCSYEKVLLNSIIRLIFQHDVKTYNYAMGKASYYCDNFSEMYTKLMDNFLCDRFVNICKNIPDDSTNLGTHELGSKIIECMFNKTLELLHKSSDDLHNNYESCFQKSTHAVSSEETGSIFKFKVPKTDLNKELCCDTAIKHLPFLSLKLTKDSFKFESYFDQLAFISFNDDNFKLIFYFNENGENLDGLLMYIKFLP